MAGNIKILCYGNGNIKNGEDGIYYDGGLVKMIKLGTDANYGQLLHVICTRLGINPKTHQVDMSHRCISGNQGGKVQYVLVSINDDDDVLTLIDFAQDMGSRNIPELYIMTSSLPIPLLEVDVTRTALPMHETHENEPVGDNNYIEAQVDHVQQDPPIDVDEEFDDESPLDRCVVGAAHSPEHAENRGKTGRNAQREIRGNRQTSMDQRLEDNSMLDCQDRHHLVQVQEVQMDPFELWDSSVLHLQDKHRSRLVWNEEEAHLLTCRRREASLRRGAEIHLDPRMVPFVEQAGFAGISRLKFIQLDWHLITALVERWRPETHTFHMTQGEMTITLQDVVVLFGLKVDGDAVIGRTNLSTRETCERYLGIAPANDEKRGGRIRMKWLADVFQQLPQEVDEETVKRYTRAYILQLIGGILFPDKSGNLVHVMWLPLLEDFAAAGRLSWGSACLAWLYRQLCRAADVEAEEIGGALILLQIWAWDRFPFIAPMRRRITWERGSPLACRWQTEFDTTQQPTHVISFYRLAFDQQTPNQVVWQPYTEEIIAGLPAYCSVGREIWLARVPLICFCIVEFYYPDRVMRQFGGRQGIPETVDTDKKLHSTDLRGRVDQQWDRVHAPYIVLWQERRNRVIRLDPVETFEESVAPDYFQWFYNITRRYMVQHGAMIGYLREAIDRIASAANQDEVGLEDRMAKIREIACKAQGSHDQWRGADRRVPTDSRRRRRRRSPPPSHGQTPSPPRAPTPSPDPSLVESFPPSHPSPSYAAPSCPHPQPTSTSRVAPSSPPYPSTSHATRSFLPPRTAESFPLPCEDSYASTCTPPAPQSQRPSTNDVTEMGHSVSQFDPMAIEVAQQDSASASRDEATSHVTQTDNHGLSATPTQPPTLTQSPNEVRYRHRHRRAKDGRKNYS